MAVDVGDLIPRSSGTSSLGVEQVGLCGFTTDVRPFCHVHMNSGVMHNITGNSGVLRYGSESIEVSNDGGITYNSVLVDTDLSLQAAFNGGREIGILKNNGQNVGTLIKEQPGIFNAGISAVNTAANEHYGLAVSGFTATPLNPNSYSIARLNSNGLTIQGSGTSSQQAGRMFLGYSGGSNLARIQCSGLMAFAALDYGAADGGMDFSASSSWNASCGDGGMSFVSVGGIFYSTSNGNLELSAGLGGDGLGGQIELSAFTGSGQLEYRFGPFEAWHTSPSHTADFFPIPHSGQVNQMILESTPNVGLQAAYDNDPTIVLDNGDLILTADSSKTILASFLTQPTLNVSGILDEGTFEELGDINLFAHSNPGKETQATSLAEVAALSLGIPTIGIGTNGSGIAPLAVASGVQRFRDNNGTSITTTFGTHTVVSVESQRFEDDQFYAYDSSTGGVKVFVAGSYLLTGSILLASNTTETLWSAFGVNGTAVNASRNASPCLANSFVALTPVVVVNLKPGDIVTIEAAKTSAGATVVAAVNESALNIIYLGPHRGPVA